VKAKRTFVENMMGWVRGHVRAVRTIVVGKIVAFEDGTRERTADFNPGISDLQAGTATPISMTPDAPVLFLAGGGFAVLLPSAADDEVLGLVSDRATGLWRQNREVGEADEINGKRAHNMSDVLLTQFSMTAPTGAPATWDHYMVIGPGGKAIEVNTDDSIVLTKQGSTVATITMAASGSVTIDVAVGQSVNVGGPGALTLTKWAALETAVGALLDAGAAAVGSPADPAGENAGAAFALAKAAWEIAIGLNSPEALKAKGE
jgi:hypothetical protein